MPANRSTPFRQIIGSFEDIGKDIVRETAKVPADIAGKALESLGQNVSNKSGQSSQKVMTGSFDATPKAPDSWDKIHDVKDTKIKQAVARSALTALTQRQVQKEPSVWEKLQMEADKKKEQQSQAMQKQQSQTLPKISTAPKRGNLYGIKAKQNSAEMSRNVRQD